MRAALASMTPGLSLLPKAMVRSSAPVATIVDISHQIAPQDLAEGAFVLAAAYRCFPSGTVHVAVVDPGVGTDRRGILIETERGVLVGPDNGLFGGVLAFELRDDRRRNRSGPRAGPAPA